MAPADGARPVYDDMIRALMGDFLVVHAGAVGYQGAGILLPAGTGSGKTTLVAGLAANGFQLFSDEFGVVSFDSGERDPQGWWYRPSGPHSR